MKTATRTRHGNGAIKVPVSDPAPRNILVDRVATKFDKPAVRFGARRAGQGYGNYAIVLDVDFCLASHIVFSTEVFRSLLHMTYLVLCVIDVHQSVYAICRYGL